MMISEAIPAASHNLRCTPERCLRRHESKRHRTEIQIPTCLKERGEGPKSRRNPPSTYWAAIKTLPLRDYDDSPILTLSLGRFAPDTSGLETCVTRSNWLCKKTLGILRIVSPESSIHDFYRTLASINGRSWIPGIDDS